MNKFAFENYIPEVLNKLEFMVEGNLGELSLFTAAKLLRNQLKKDLADRLEQIESAKEGLTWLAG